jgi:hypothetical protein
MGWERLFSGEGKGRVDLAGQLRLAVRPLQLAGKGIPFRLGSGRRQRRELRHPVAPRAC